MRRRIEFALLRRLAAWSLMRLFLRFNHDPNVDRHLMNHVEAAVEGAWETGCTKEHCALRPQFTSCDLYTTEPERSG